MCTFLTGVYEKLSLSIGAKQLCLVGMCEGPATNQPVHCETVYQTISISDTMSPRHPLETELEHQPVAEGATGEASVGMCEGLALDGMQGPPCRSVQVNDSNNSTL